jgi:NAD(P)-dependent dehydrogenase (short-subunit alcohol dehydrogenase family)
MWLAGTYRLGSQDDRKKILELAPCEAKVVVNYLRASGLAEKVVQEIKALGSDAGTIKADVTNVAETVRLFEEAVRHYARLDIVSSNAGVVSFGHLEHVTELRAHGHKKLATTREMQRQRWQFTDW